MGDRDDKQGKLEEDFKVFITDQIFEEIEVEIFE